MTDELYGFINYLSDVKKASVNTVEAYKRDIGRFSDYCSEFGVFDHSLVDESIIRKYIDNLSLLGKSESTILRSVASVRGYFKYLISVGICEANPADGIKLSKSSHNLPGILDSNEIVLLLSQPSGNDFKSIRDKAMLETLYATGIRVSELISLTVGDVNIQLNILHTSGAREKERVIPLYPAAAKHLSEYINNVRPILVQDSSNKVLFTNMNGKPMSRQGFWKIIKHYAEKAGINKDITPHTFRHSLAAHLLENGAPLKDVKEMLGHSDISSTQVYAQIIKNKYVSSYAKFHPLAK